MTNKVTKMYVLRYAERNNIAQPNKDAPYRIVDSIHDTISKVKQTEIKPTSDDLTLDNSWLVYLLYLEVLPLHAHHELPMYQSTISSM